VRWWVRRGEIGQMTDFSLGTVFGVFHYFFLDVVPFFFRGAVGLGGPFFLEG